MSSDVETHVGPPPADEDDGGLSGRMSLSWLDVDDSSKEAAIQLFDEAAVDPARFADALLGVSLAVASLRGPDFTWAVMQRFAAYDGLPT